MPFPPGSPFERFFRRFGMPQCARTARGGHEVITGQGSGFFISRRRLCGDQQSRRAKRRERRGHDRRRQDLLGQGDRHRPAHRPGADQGRGRPTSRSSSFPTARRAIGDWVLAVGNPFGLGGTVTAGIVSARGRDIGAGPYDDFIQIDAPVNKGNSGGPTFDVDGNVIGVNTAIFSPSGGSVGIAFAIPADTVKSVVAQLKDKGSGHPRLDRRSDPAGHARHRRQPGPEAGRQARWLPNRRPTARPPRPASRAATSSPRSTARRSRMPANSRAQSAPWRRAPRSSSA